MSIREWVCVICLTIWKNSVANDAIGGREKNFLACALLWCTLAKSLFCLDKGVYCSTIVLKYCFVRNNGRERKMV